MNEDAPLAGNPYGGACSVQREQVVTTSIGQQKMYSYSANPTLAVDASIALGSFIDSVFAQNAQVVMDIAENEEPRVVSMDIEDVNQSRNGNHEAYRRLVERHEQDIARIMWRFSRDKLVHEELVQDVFVEAYLSLRTYKQHAPFRNWLGKIATRVGYRFWKERSRRNNRKSFSLREWDSILSKSPDDIESEQAGELVHKLLEQLPPRDRLVLTLRFVEGCDVEQTAYRTGWSKSMVKVQTARAKSKLRKLFPDA